MTDLLVSDEIPLTRRLELLRRLPSIEALDLSAIEEIAGCLGVEVFETDEVINSESQFGDRMYIIESGVVGVFTDGPAGTIQIGKLSEGDRFGEISLLSSTRRRRATVRAFTPVVVLTLLMPDYERIVALYPDLRVDLACAAGAFMQARLEALMQAKTQKMGAINKSPLSF